MNILRIKTIENNIPVEIKVYYSQLFLYRVVSIVVVHQFMLIF